MSGNSDASEAADGQKGVAKEFVEQALHLINERQWRTARAKEAGKRELIAAGWRPPLGDGEAEPKEETEPKEEALLTLVGEASYEEKAAIAAALVKDFVVSKAEPVKKALPQPRPRRTPSFPSRLPSGRTNCGPHRRPSTPRRISSSSSALAAVFSTTSASFMTGWRKS